MTVDAPARAIWMSMKQFNGYYGCGKCEEPGEQLVIGGEEGKKRQSHIYPFNNDSNNLSGHARVRTHQEMKNNALMSISNQESGMSKVIIIIITY